MDTDALLVYLEGHPLAAAALAVLAVLVLGSLLRKLVRVAMVLAVVLIVALYWTHREARVDLQVRAEVLRRHAAQLGQGAVEAGKQIIDEGRQELQKNE